MANKNTSGVSPEEMGQAQEVEWTYLGIGVDAQGKPFHRWLTPQGDTKTYYKVGPTAAVIGGIYRIKLLSDGSVLIGRDGPAWLRMSHSEQVPVWKADHLQKVAVLEARRAGKRAQTEHAGDLGKMTLSEAATWYRKVAMPNQRAGKLAVLVEYLLNGRLEEGE